VTILAFRRLWRRGLEEVCDLPEAGGHRRMFVAGHLPQDPGHLAADAGDERRDLRDPEAGGEGVVSRREPQRPGHGA